MGSEPFTPHWGYTQFPEAHHVIPPDGYDHSTYASTCDCQPTVNGAVVTHHRMYRREYTAEEEARIRAGDAYDPEDSDVSDEIIARGKWTRGH